ncbi:DNA binding protein [Aureococcus anophagefferens]|nr:DNA binding protein [Aureococcus anophagefferens]
MSSVPSAGEDCDDLGEPPVALDTFELFEIDTWSDLDARPEGGASLEELLDPNASLQHEIVRTLFSLLNGPFAETLIAWSDDGERIVIADPPRFAEEICPKFFRHKNWTSFSRLLNMYEFHKIPAPPQLTPLIEYKHPDFRRDGGGDIWKVVRKKSPSESAGATKRTRVGGRPPKKAIVSRVLMPAVPRGPAGAPPPPPPRVVCYGPPVDPLWSAVERGERLTLTEVARPRVEKAAPPRVEIAAPPRVSKRCRVPSHVAYPVFRVGDEVEAKWDGTWHPAVVDDVLYQEEAWGPGTHPGAACRRAI